MHASHSAFRAHRAAPALPSFHSTDILKLLADTGRLKREHLTALWSSSRGKHEACVRVLYRLMVDLVPDFNHKDRKYLFSHLENLAFDKWDERTLALAHDYTVAALDADKRDANAVLATAAEAVAGGEPVQVPHGSPGHPEFRQYWYGIDLLWAFCQDDASVGIEVALCEDAIAKVRALPAWVACGVKVLAALFWGSRLRLLGGCGWVVVVVVPMASFPHTHASTRTHPCHPARS